MKVKAHRLFYDNDEPVTYIRSPNQTKGVVVSPTYLVMHYTAGASAESSISWLTNKNAQASAHLVISRDGDVTQLVDFNKKAWHAGRSSWRGLSGMNNHSIGIELDNPGVLVGEPTRWKTQFGRSVSDDDVVVTYDDRGNAVGWHAYTEKQLEVAREVSVILANHYNLRDILGHEDIAPGRKKDPGPAFPMSLFKSSIMGRNDDSDEDSDAIYYTTTTLNIRTGPGTQYDKLDASPLPSNTKLNVLKANGVWREVEVIDTLNGDMDIVGWVHGKFIESGGN